jgi:hypothetical protein
MIDLLRLPASEAERLAYAEGFYGTAELFARIVDLEQEVKQLQDEVCRLESALMDVPQ